MDETTSQNQDHPQYTPKHPTAHFVDSIEWEATEYLHFDKTTDWYWGLGIVAVTIAVISMLLGNFFFGLFILVAAFTLALYAHRPPRLVRIHINRKGIVIEKTLYRFIDLESFWIEEDELHKKILIKSKKYLMPYVIVPLGEMDPEHMRDVLLDFLPEVEHHEPYLMRLMEHFGF